MIYDSIAYLLIRTSSSDNHTLVRVSTLHGLFEIFIIKGRKALL